MVHLHNLHGPIVDVGYVCDISRETVIPKYGGIPYAKPPVGDLRFREIVPLNTTRFHEENNFNVEAVVNATYYPDFCIQEITGHGCITMDAGGARSEDCWKANIFTHPTVPKKAITCLWCSRFMAELDQSKSECHHRVCLLPSSFFRLPNHSRVHRPHIRRLQCGFQESGPGTRIGQVICWQIRRRPNKTDHQRSERWR
ncbi:hypothetical protein BDR05DRAFT_958576 [Suillus weaverae]|nr:hypothetical protein BDR05DRAFT_958576 [Suillus weaverae]